MNTEGRLKFLVKSTVGSGCVVCICSPRCFGRLRKRELHVGGLPGQQSDTPSQIKQTCMYYDKPLFIYFFVLGMEIRALYIARRMMNF